MLRRWVGYVLRYFSPTYGWCGRCKWPWNVVKGHTTWFGRGRGCFPLCEGCWRGLTPEGRLPYYRGMWNCWRTGGRLVDGWDYAEELAVAPDEEWWQIQAAVLAGR